MGVSCFSGNIIKIHPAVICYHPWCSLHTGLYQLAFYDSNCSNNMAHQYPSWWHHQSETPSDHDNQLMAFHRLDHHLNALPIKNYVHLDQPLSCEPLPLLDQGHLVAQVHDMPPTASWPVFFWALTTAFLTANVNAFPRYHSYPALILSRYHSSDPRCDKWRDIAAEEDKCTEMQQSNDIKVVNNTQRCAESNGKQQNFCY
jgi:hypothetical protein